MLIILTGLLIIMSTNLALCKDVQPNSRYITYRGRLDMRDSTAYHYSWTGISFSLRFEGSSIGIRLKDGRNRYNVVLNGENIDQLITLPGKIDYLLAEDLPEGIHTITVSKRHETNWGVSSFLGFYLQDGVLHSPEQRSDLRIEFIGDSFVAGYGNESPDREGTGGGYVEYTNGDRAFGPILANNLGADYMVHGYSGKGLLRNASNDAPGKPFPLYYKQIIHSSIEYGHEPLYWDFSNWIPQLVIIHLGINDFSGDQVEPADPNEYRDAYRVFVNNLRREYSGAQFVLLSFPDWPHNLFRKTVASFVEEERESGFNDIHHFHYSVAAEALHWHPSVAEHQFIASQLEEFLRKENLLDPSVNLISERGVVEKLHLKRVGEMFQIDGARSGDELKIYSLSGRVLYSSAIDERSLINTSSFVKGAYICELKRGKKVITFPFSKL